MKENTVAEFVWTDSKYLPRGKTRVFKDGIPALEKIPVWWYDGSSTGQAQGFNSDLFLCARRQYNDPFRKGQKIFVCDVYNDIELKTPNFANKRNELAQLVEENKHEDVWVGIEQEYVLYDRKTNLPLNWKGYDEPGWGQQGPYYCSVGGHKAFGRAIVEEHMEKCLEAGIALFGINGEVMPSQWEFQIGTCGPMQVCDDLVLARYILERVAEKYDAYVNWHPKPFPNWNGSGAHTNFSTKAMRSEGGFEVIQKAMELLAETHVTDIENYGEDNHLRLTGHHETSSMKTFSWDFSDRGKSVRVAAIVKTEGKGYFEDRRPASNMNPYLVLGTLFKSLFRKKADSK